MKIKFFALATMLIVSSHSFAQEQMLTLSKAISYALKNKADAQKAQIEIEKAEYKIDEARANALPQINIGAGLTYNPILQEVVLPNLGAIKMGTDWQARAAVSLQQAIFNYSVFTGLKAAKTTLEFYKINADLTEEQIIEKVATNYYEIYKSQSQLATINKTIENTMRMKTVLDGLYKNGLAKKIEIDRLSVSLNNLSSTKQQILNGIEVQENALKYLIGMDMNEKILLPKQNFEVSQLALTSIEEINVENRTEVKVLEKQTELLNLSKEVNNAAHYPSLYLTANYGYLGQGDDFPLLGSNKISWSSFSAIGLNLSIPIFTGGATVSKIRQAEKELETIEMTKKDVKLALNLEHKNAITQLNNAIITLQTQKDNVNLAKEVLSNIENNYKNGLAPLTDLLDAENSYAQAQNNYANAQLEYKLAEIKLIKSKGELKTLITE